MANKERIDQLKNGVIEWNRWRATNKNIALDIIDINLSGADLNGVNLIGADLDGVNLSGANLSGANLTGANLRGARLINADCSDTDLGGANLSGAKLSGANLHCADLSGANLRSTDLRSTDLRRADLSDADLHRADLRDADLRRADLSGVDLSYADLSYAEFHNANFYQTILNETALPDVDLENVRNLESCCHLGPSTIDHRTMKKSGMLPTIFLRGCGLPDTLIDYYPSFLNQSISYYSCFISYSHSDKTFARRLHDQLQGMGIRCWLDEHQMLPGDKIIEQVDQGIRIWDKVLLCASEQSLSSWWVGTEIEKAFKKEETLMKQRGKEVLSLIPLNLDGHLFNWENAWADKIRSRYAPDFSNWKTNNDIFEQSFERIVKALQADNSGREPPPISKL